MLPNCHMKVNIVNKIGSFKVKGSGVFNLSKIQSTLGIGLST